MAFLYRMVAALALVIAITLPAAAADQIGQIKIVSGDVRIIRDGQPKPAEAGDAVLESDVVETGPNSAVGMTFTDNSRISLGPDSRLAMEAYIYSRPGKKDSFDARLDRGSLTAASGKIAKSRPLAMRVLTPTTVLGVKGTTFAVRVKA